MHSSSEITLKGVRLEEDKNDLNWVTISFNALLRSTFNSHPNCLQFIHERPDCISIEGFIDDGNLKSIQQTHKFWVNKNRFQGSFESTSGFNHGWFLGLFNHGTCSRPQVSDAFKGLKVYWFLNNFLFFKNNFFKKKL